MTAPSYCVIIPSYNSGPALVNTVDAVSGLGLPVWVVLDGSTDGSEAAIGQNGVSSVAVISLQQNVGKGGAVLAGMQAARGQRFTHAVVMDADGQHDVGSVIPFIEKSIENPDALILGVPIFGPDAPIERVKGRRIGNWFANLDSLWLGIDDSLFGFRVYPLEPSIAILSSIRSARRFDFDTELAVRLVWAGVKPINLKTRVFYPAASDGGVSHFRYVRDNVLLVCTHARLIVGMVLRLPRLCRLRRQWL
ncbi:MAG: glycosyltransferase family 2 protein [Chthoniobacterales bacterium]